VRRSAITISSCSCHTESARTQDKFPMPKAWPSLTSEGWLSYLKQFAIPTSEEEETEKGNAFVNWKLLIISWLCQSLEAILGHSMVPSTESLWSMLQSYRSVEEPLGVVSKEAFEKVAMWFEAEMVGENEVACVSWKRLLFGKCLSLESCPLYFIWCVVVS